MKSPFMQYTSTYQKRVPARRSIEKLPAQILEATSETGTAERKGSVRKVVFPAVMLTLLALVISMLSVRYYMVSGGSMLPSLQEGDILYYTSFQTYSYGDLIIFRGDKTYGMIVKRVIGLPGDTIEINSDGCVIRNNVLIEEDYIECDELGNSAMPPVVVGDGMLFVLGDNRAESIDSRDIRIGQIQIENVYGKVEKIVRAINNPAKWYASEDVYETS
jgi:signal peptidase I